MFCSQSRIAKVYANMLYQENFSIVSYSTANNFEYLKDLQDSLVYRRSELFTKISLSFRHDLHLQT